MPVGAIVHVLCLQHQPLHATFHFAGISVRTLAGVVCGMYFGLLQLQGCPSESVKRGCVMPSKALGCMAARLVMNRGTYRCSHIVNASVIEALNCMQVKT